jgi:MFS family permease
MGVTMGTLSANLIGGPVADAFGWRTAFMVIGAAGIVVAIAFRLTVKEPPRGYSDPPGLVRPKKASFSAALKELSSKRSFWLMAAGATLASFCGYGIVTFQTSFLIRTHGVTLTEATLLFNVPSAFAASIGVFMTGWMAERVVKRHPNAIAWLPAIGSRGVRAVLPAGLQRGEQMGGAVRHLHGRGHQVWLSRRPVHDRAGRGRRADAGDGDGDPALHRQPARLWRGSALHWLSVGYLLFASQASAEGFADLARASCKGAALAGLPEAAQAFCRAAEAKALQNSLLITSVLYATAGDTSSCCASRRCRRIWWRSRRDRTRNRGA